MNEQSTGKSGKKTFSNEMERNRMQRRYGCKTYYENEIKGGKFADGATVACPNPSACNKYRNINCEVEFIKHLALSLKMDAAGGVYSFSA